MTKMFISDLVTMLTRGKAPEYDENGNCFAVKSAQVFPDTIRWQSCPPVSDRFGAKHKTIALQKGDVLLNGTGTGSLGRPGFVRHKLYETFIPDSHVNLIRVNTDLIRPEYLFYWLMSPRGQQLINVSYTGSTNQIELSADKVSELSLFVPKPEEQDRVVAFLKHAERSVLLQTELTKQLQSLLASRFYEEFGDLSTGSRDCPIVSVSSFVKGFETGKSIAPDSSGLDTNLRILKVSAVTWMDYDATASKPVPDDYEPPKSHYVKPGDLLFSRANTTELIGAVAYVFETPPNLVLPDKIWRFIFKAPDECDPLFCWQLFKQPFLRTEISKRSTGTSGSMKNISQDRVMDIRVAMPSYERQREYGVFARKLQRIRDLRHESLRQMEMLFDSRIVEAFSTEQERKPVLAV